MTSHCPLCNLTLADNEDCLHIKGGRMTYPDEHDWLKQYDKPYSLRSRITIMLGLIAAGTATIVGISMAVNWFVEKAL